MAPGTGRRAALLGIAGVGALAVAFASGVALGSRGGSQSPPSAPAVSADRAIALVVGQARATDHMTFDAWYRARMDHLAPGIDIEYQALHSGNAACGDWMIVATVVPGPFHGAQQGLQQGLDALNTYGPIADVDQVSGQIFGVGPHSGGTSFRVSGGCSIRPVGGTGPSWLDEFRAGAAAWPFTP